MNSSLPRTLDELHRVNAELDRRIFDLQALHKAGQALHHVLDVAALGVMLIAMVRERSRAERIAVLLHDSDAKRVSVLHATGLPDKIQQLGFPANDGILWRLLLAGEPFSVVDLDGRPRFPELFTEHGLQELGGTTWLPMVLPDRVVGLVSLGTMAGGEQVAAAQIAFLGALAHEAALAFDTARLYQGNAIARRELDRSLHKLSMLFDITRALGAVQDFEVLSQMILERAIEAVDAEKGSLMLLDEATDELVVRVVRLPDNREMERKINNREVACSRFGRGEGIAGTVLATGVLRRIDDVDQDGTFTWRAGSNVRSILCVPLLRDDECIGVLNLTNRKGNLPFRAEDEEVLVALAQQASAALARTRLYVAAITDGLTQLFVRGHVMGCLAKEVKRARRYGTALSIVMCDIDHFKRVNDGYGHPAGDKVIIAVAEILRTGVRSEDIVGRYGGEEFLLVLPHTPLADAMIAVERLRARVEERVVDIGDGASLQVTMSFGLAELGAARDTSVEELVKWADNALYRAKAEGRNRVVPAVPFVASEGGGDVPALATNSG